MGLLEWLNRLKAKFKIWRFKTIYKDKLPEKFDVFWVGCIDNDQSDLVVPGNIYVQNSLSIKNIYVGESIFVDGLVNCANITVGGSFISSSPTAVRCFTAKIGQLFDCYDVLSRHSKIHATDYVCRIYEE